MRLTPSVKSSNRGTQPSVEVFRPLKTEQRLRQVLQPLQGQGANTGFLHGGEVAATAAELAQGQIQFAFLPALLTTLLAAFQPALAKWSASPLLLKGNDFVFTDPQLACTIESSPEL